VVEYEDNKGKLDEIGFFTYCYILFDVTVISHSTKSSPSVLCV